MLRQGSFKEKMMEQESKIYIDLLLDEPAQVGRWLGFSDLQKLHNEWIMTMTQAAADVTILAHRGSYKTTCLTLAIAIIIILYPKQNLMLLRKTDNDVKEVIRQVSKLLKSEVLQHIVYKIYKHDLQFVEDTTYGITTNLQTGNKGHSQLIGLGLGSSITGKHADVIITDDIVNIKDRASKAERDHTKNAYMELQNIKNRGGRILNAGTPWHKEDAISTMPSIQIFDCYTTGLISNSELQEIRQKMTPSLFAANYELKHIADSEALFQAPKFISDYSVISDGLAHIDAAYGGKDGTALTLVKQQGEQLYMYGKLWKGKHVDDCLDEVYSILDNYKIGLIYLEKNADKGYLAQKIKKTGRPVKSYHENHNKYIKISTHLRQSWSNIKWLENTCNEYMLQILDYTANAEHDDAPDSAASLLRFVSKKKKGFIT